MVIEDEPGTFLGMKTIEELKKLVQFVKIEKPNQCQRKEKHILI